MATISTNQEQKQITVPGSDPYLHPWVRYNETYSWDLDATNFVPVNVRVNRNIA
jgi:hypothetical protein